MATDIPIPAPPQARPLPATPPSPDHRLAHDCVVSGQLEELVAALDRRVPRADRAGEAAIARDAATLRAKAIDRLAELATSPATCTARDPGASK